MEVSGISLDRQVKHLKDILKGVSDEVSRRIITRAIRAGTMVIHQSIQAHVPTKYEDIRPLIGFRFKRKKAIGIAEAKTGVGVGITKRRIAQEVNHDIRVKRKARQDAGKKSSGVGISANNVHWLFLGTQQRTNKAGKNLGAMPRVLDGVVKAGFAASSDQAMRTMTEVVMTGLERYRKKVARDASADARKFAKAARSAKLKKVK